MQWATFSAALSHLPAREQERIHRAFELGKTMHGDQKRKSGEPYFTHPIAVATILAGMGADADTVIAALLHDTVEDTDLTLNAIDQEFNGSVRSLIDGVTKLFSGDFNDKPTLDEQKETLRKIFTLMQEDVRVMVIKLVDRLHNMKTIQFLQEERQQAMAQETQDVFVKIADRLCMQDLRDALEELTLQILEKEAFPTLLELRRKSDEHAHEAAQMMHLEFSKPGMPKHLKIHPESKQWSDVQQQMEKGKGSVTGLADIVLAFECASIPACYEVLGSLHQRWRREAMSFQDFINSPKINGYQGLHTTIILPNGMRVRCKIRTKDMQIYAHRGIAAYCFDSKAKGLLEYLPWVQHIQSLSEDTKNRSEEFFESLKSDILGESIVVHGTGDHTVLLPAGSTALDGAFYCFHEKALRIKAIRINGQLVPFSTLLNHSVSIDIELNSRFTVHREWLDWVHTGVATAMIRGALSNQSKHYKQVMGKEILQKRMDEQKLGYIEEFDRRTIVSTLAKLGYTSLEDVYVALADGREDVSNVCKAIFAKRNPSAIQRGDRQWLIFYIKPEFARNMDLTHFLEKFYGHFHSIKMSFSKRKQQRKIIIDFSATPDVCNAMLVDIKGIGVKHFLLRRRYSFIKLVVGIAIIMTLWGMDPVIGYEIIQRNQLSAIDLTLIRFWSLTSISGMLLLFQKYRSNLKQSWLHINSKSLWLSVFFLISVSLTTYISLQTTIPCHYTIPMTAAGIIMTSIVHKKRWHILIVTWLLLLSGFIFLIANDPSWGLQGIFFTILSVLSFSGFSIVSERYKREENIAARSAQYFFLLSALCAILTLPLLTVSTLSSIPFQVLAQMTLFSITLVGLPYYMYYFFLSHQAIDFVLRYSFLIILVTMFGQLLFEHEVSTTILIASSLVMLGAMLPLIHHVYYNVTSPRR